MLNRDGAETIRECLESVAALADEMIVIDTGSRDDSPEIARRRGAAVVERPWPDDFSAARNEYLRLAEGQWILSLDSDELLGPCRRDELIALLEAEPDTAFRVTVRNYFLLRDYERSLSPGELADRPLPGVGVTHSHTIRLFPNRPGVAYSYPVHESLVPSLHRLRIRIRDLDLAVHHLGFVTGRRGMHDKFTRYLELGYRKLRENPSHPLAYLELGKLLSCAGRMEEAAELFDACLRRAPGLPDAHYYAALARFRLRHDDQCRQRLQAALRVFPHDLNLRYLSAMLDEREGRSDRALETLVVLAAEGPEHFPTQLHLAAGYLRGGRLADAEAVLRRAREMAPWQAGVYLLEAELARMKGETSCIDDILAQGVAAAGPVPELVGYRRVAYALERTAS
jgi:glycosyltransferase involved in cell wall biosynthesis